MLQESEANDQAEALVNTLQLEGANLNDANLSSLSSSDLEQLANLQAELDSINAAELDSDNIDLKQGLVDGDIVETEIGEEVIIETEELDQEDDIEEQIPVEPLIRNEAKEAPPPLRPLTIAPKPVKVSQMALKTVVNQGQQIVLIQSPGGTTSTVNLAGQQIKLVSTQGQPILQNLQLTKQPGGSQQLLQLRTVPKTDSPTVTTSAQTQLKGAIKKIIPQNSKNIVTKMIVGGQQVVQIGNTDHQQQIKLVTSSATLPANAKTITLAQAQQMGLITGGKVQQIVPQSPGKQTLIVNKQIGGKTIKVVPQIKSPTKILPAPIQAQKVVKPALQRVIIKQGGQLKTVATSAATAVTTGQSGVNQVIRLPAGQTISSAAAAGQIHQINVPGKGVQYIRFMPTSSVANSTIQTNTTVTSTSISSQKQLQKAQVVPVAGISVNRPATNKILNVATTTNNTATQNVIKVVPLSSSQTRPVAPKPITTQRVLIPASNTQTRSAITTIPASALSQILPSGNNVSQIVMLPAQYVQQLPPAAKHTKLVPQKTPASTTPPPAVCKDPDQLQSANSSSVSSANLNLSTLTELSSSPPDRDREGFNRTLEPNGIRPRKPCNCTKSLCLKLYCDCFANGEFCHLCNCMNCYNNLDHEEERSRAIRNCLERNPNAFRPKIGKGKDSSESSVRKHTKGCNCKRSGCLKNYCECYEAKIACSSNCKCIGCRNIEDSMEKKNVRPLTSLMPDSHLMQVVPQTKSTKNIVPPNDVAMFRPLITNTTNKSPSSYMTNDVIEATTQCLLARAEEAERSMLSDEAATRIILEEFGRCLVEIINCAKTASNNQNT